VRVVVEFKAKPAWVRVVRGARSFPLSASLEASCRSTGRRRAREAGQVGSAILDKRSSIKCMADRATVPGLCPRVSPSAGQGHLCLSPIAATAKGLLVHCAATPVLASSGSDQRRPVVRGPRRAGTASRRPPNAMHAITTLCIEVLRLTVGCSEPADHKVLGRGRPASCAARPHRARVLQRRRPVAEPSS
jgi:hypothetical protein